MSYFFNNLDPQLCLVIFASMLIVGVIFGAIALDGHAKEEDIKAGIAGSGLVLVVLTPFVIGNFLGSLIILAVFELVLEVGLLGLCAYLAISEYLEKVRKQRIFPKDIEKEIRKS